MSFKEINFPIEIDVLLKNTTKNMDCLEWKGRLNNKGYGVFCYKKEKFLAHRVSFFAKNKFLDSTKLICHKCDNPRCINPDHLFIGTYKENMNDMMTKKRHYSQTNPEKASTNGFFKKNPKIGNENPYRNKRIKQNKMIGAFKNGNKWRCLVRVNGKLIHIGNFNTQQEAHDAYVIFINRDSL